MTDTARPIFKALPKPKRARGRPRTGQTSPVERARKTIERLHAAGGRRVVFLADAGTAACIAKIREREQLQTDTAAVIEALNWFARKRSTK